MAEAPAQSFGRYRMDKLLGQGGCGRVYQAWDPVLDRPVALKVLTSVDPADVHELLREARAQARVDHPHVCKVFEIEESGGGSFITMQLISGPTLSQEAPSLSLLERVAVVADVAEGVEAAHRLGIVHRDLKPANIMLELTSSGWHAYVMDFGLARDVSTTLSSRVVGTPAYMAPEQARGEAAKIGPRTDVYGLGATLFSVLAGMPPYSGTVLEVLERLQRAEPPSLRAQIPDVPRELELIVATAMAQDPQRRYATAEAFADDLRRFLAREPIEARRPSLAYRARRFVGRHRVASAALALTIAAGAIFMVAWPRARWTPRIAPLGPTYEEWAGAVSVAPDGSELVYASNRDGGWRIYAERLAGARTTGEPRALTPAGMIAYGPHFAGDGDRVLFVRQTGTVLDVASVPRAGGPIATVAPGAAEVDRCGAGRAVFRYQDTPGCADCERLVLRELSAERLLLRGPPVDYFLTPSCDAAGRAVVFRHRRMGEEESRLEVIDLAGGGSVRAITAPLDRMTGPLFHPDGRSVLFTRARQLWEVDAQGGHPPVLLSDGLDYAEPTVGPGGDLLFFNERRSDRPIFVETAAGVRRRITPEMVSVLNVAITPDARELVYSIEPEGPPEVHVLSLDGGADRKLVADVHSMGLDYDGKSLYFLRGNGDAARLFAVPVQGGEPREVALIPGAYAIRTARDGVHGTSIVGTSVVAWRIRDGVTVEPEPPDITYILPSPDGRFEIVVLSDDEAADVVRRAGAPLDDPANVRVRWSGLRWFADGAVLGSDGTGVKRLDPESGAIRELFHGEILSVDSWAVSPDGATLYRTVQLDHTRRMIMGNFGDRPRP